MKSKRLEAIKAIVSNQFIQSQDELQKALEIHGFSVTQATLSRDLRELSIVKANVPGRGYSYSISFPSDPEPFAVNQRKITTDPIRRVEFSSSFGVIRTFPGFAGAVASVIDDNDVEGIMGTIAGDDCILLVCRDGVDKGSLVKRLSQFIPGISSKLVK